MRSKTDSSPLGSRKPEVDGGPAEAAIDNARVMIVVSHDYGELAEAMYFVSGRSFCDRTTIVLPTRLSGLNAEALGVSTRHYGSLYDLMKIADDTSPDVVLFFSGYLLVQQQLISEGGFDTFLDQLRRQGCAVATTDPLGGYMATAVANFTGASSVGDHGYSDFEAGVLRVFEGPHERLKRFPHIYPYAYDGDGSREHSTFSYFNSRSSADHRTEASTALLREALGSRFGEPFWLFSIGREDHEMQVDRLGSADFVGHVAGRLETASGLGRTVVFVGPDALVQTLTDALRPSEAVRLFPYLPFAMFAALNLHAEYAFYWNVTSASALTRILNGLPTFHFAHGHMAHSLPHAYERVVNLFFAGGEPLMLDPVRPFERDDLERLSTGARQAIATLKESLERLQSPDDLITQLLRARPGATQASGLSPKTNVWTYWHATQRPRVVEECFASWRRHLDPDRFRIVILSEGTVEEYLSAEWMAQLPELRELPQANRSDFIRLSLLKLYGGVWLDASIFLWSDLEFLHDSDEFYAPRVPLVDFRAVQNWLLAAPKDDYVITKWLDGFVDTVRGKVPPGHRWWHRSFYSYLLPNYLKVYVAFANLSWVDAELRRHTPGFRFHGVKVSMNMVNVFKLLRIRVLHKCGRFDAVVAIRDCWELPSLALTKGDELILYKLNALDRELIRDMEVLGSARWATGMKLFKSLGRDLVGISPPSFRFSGSCG